MNQPETHFYCASQFAAALGVTPRAIKLRLEKNLPDGTAKMRGQTAKAWSLAALPASLTAELTALSQTRGFAAVAQILEQPAAPWQPARPWHSIPQPFRDRAEQLAQALAPVLARQHELSGPDLMDQAAMRYRQEFRHEITDDKLRYIMDRATRRDNGFAQFQRPELYLDDAAFHEAPGAGALEWKALHQPLEATIATIEHPSSPSLDDVAFLFHAAFAHFESLVQDHPSTGQQRAIKHSLVNYLYRNVPGIYRPQAASASDDKDKPLLSVRRLFNLNYSQWTIGGRTVDALRDRRITNSGRKGYECVPCEKLILRAAAGFRGPHGKLGNVDMAVYQLTQKQLLCPACTSLLMKGQLPSAMRKRVTPNTLQVASLKGPDALRKIGPTKHCDWSDSQAGDRFVIDDMTTNELAWDEVDGQIISGQVQLLFTEDELSAYPLPFIMYFGAPNSLTIKKALMAVFTHIGMPHVALVTERGVFNNRMLAGDRRTKHLLPFKELEAGLKKFFGFAPMNDEELRSIRTSQLGLRDPAYGLKIHQATSPQAKSVERSFYELQKNTSILPAFGGFNQRFEKSKAMGDFDRRVAAGNEHPGNERLHLSDLRRNYERIMHEIANRPIKGMRHRGRAPLEVWQEAVARRPFRKMPAEIECLMASHRIPDVKITGKGIRIALSKFEDAFYYNEHTGPLVDQRVTVYLNYDLPGYIHIENPKTRAMLKVERSLTNRRTATADEMAAANHARRAHINGALSEIGNIANPLTSWITRDHDHTPEDKARGQAIGEAKSQHEETETKRQRGQRRIEALAQQRGDDPTSIKNPDRYQQSTERETALRARIEEKKRAASGATKDTTP